MTFHAPVIDTALLKTGSLSEEGKTAAAERESVEGFAFYEDDLSEVVGERLDFSGCTFKKCHFGTFDVKWLSFSDCRFENCDFSNAKLNKASMKRVELIDCKLIGAELIGAALFYVRFEGCAAEFVNLVEGKMNDVAFERSNFSSGVFTETTFKRVRFEACNLSRAEFYSTRLKGIDLRGNDVNALQVNGPELAGAIVSADQALELTRLLGVVIR